MGEELLRRHSETTFYRTCLGTYPHAIEVSYESLFESENSRRAMAHLEDFLGIEIRDNEPDYDRIIKDWRGMVVNHREVAEFLQHFSVDSAASH